MLTHPRLVPQTLLAAKQRRTWSGTPAPAPQDLALGELTGDSGSIRTPKEGGPLAPGCRSCPRCDALSLGPGLRPALPRSGRALAPCTCTAPSSPLVAGAQATRGLTSRKLPGESTEVPRVHWASPWGQAGHGLSPPGMQTPPERGGSRPWEPGVQRGTRGDTCEASLGQSTVVGVSLPRSARQGGGQAGPPPSSELREVQGDEGQPGIREAGSAAHGARSGERGSAAGIGCGGG